MAEINAGLGSLAELKGFLLAKSMSSTADVGNDLTLTAIGLGVAGMIEKHCNRAFAYGDAWKDERTANRSFMVAEHYPLNLAVALVVERCDSLVGGVQNWTPAPDAAYNVGAEAGIVYLAGFQGDYLSRIRLTYAGGYWWPGLIDPQPAGAPLIPADLKLAWLLQCQALWLVRDDLGIAIAGQQGGSAILGLSLPGYDLIPEVLANLARHIRYSMTG